VRVDPHRVGLGDLFPQPAPPRLEAAPAAAPVADQQAPANQAERPDNPHPDAPVPNAEAVAAEAQSSSIAAGAAAAAVGGSDPDDSAAVAPIELTVGVGAEAAEQLADDADDAVQAHAHLALVSSARDSEGTGLPSGLMCARAGQVTDEDPMQLESPPRRPHREPLPVSASASVSARQRGLRWRAAHGARRSGTGCAG
jgi:hypothetical protein